MGVTISLPEALRDWMERRAASGGFDSSGAYVVELIRRDQEDERERDEIATALAAGEASGLSERSVIDILSSLKDELNGPRR